MSQFEVRRKEKCWGKPANFRCMYVQWAVGAMLGESSRVWVLQLCSPSSSQEPFCDTTTQPVQLLKINLKKLIFRQQYQEIVSLGVLNIYFFRIHKYIAIKMFFLISPKIILHTLVVVILPFGKTVLGEQEKSAPRARIPGVASTWAKGGTFNEETESSQGRKKTSQETQREEHLHLTRDGPLSLSTSTSTMNGIMDTSL